jgi:hypothetical protein
MAVEPIPFGDQFEKAIWSFNKSVGKRIVSELGAAIGQMVASGAEPFLRRDLGERHLTPTAMMFGLGCWAFSGVLSCCLGYLLAFFGHPYLFLTSFFVTPAMCASYFALVSENTESLRRFRAADVTYHSRSCGRPRWGNKNALVISLIVVVLFLTAPIMAFVFLVSMGMCITLAAQQQTALYERYFDALDAQIEGEFLQDAILGKCPPEITNLYKPLPASLKPELRENIAAAAVGKPVKLVARPPRAKATTPTPGVQT